ncbi:MAG: hypothetical protein C0614_01830 [Desulfuromonas sp.]|nr:MAG: hypothetical protein C0614_01830 [Desulfuromonas sp.]
MKQTFPRLLVALLLALLVPNAAFAQGTGLSSSIEVGAAGISVDDEVNKVNEYSTVGDDEGANPYVKFNYLGDYGASHVDVDGAVMSGDDIDLNLDIDFRRVFRLDGSYSEFNHWLSHDQLDYMDATMKSQGQTYADGGGPVAGGSANPSVLAEDLVPNQDFFIIHKGVDLEGKVTIPSLPTVTLNAGFRQDERKGFEQEFSMSHCSACHVEGNAKEIDETTTDLSVGATGKFGMLTVDYAFLTRDFDDQSGALTNVYLLGAKPQQDLPTADFLSGRLLFDEGNGDVPFSMTPDSEKETHTLKARYDLSRDTVLSAGYIKAEVESSKKDDVGVTLATNNLETEYDAYNMRASTRFDNLRLAAYGRREEIDASSNTLTFTYANGAEVPALEDRTSYESEEAREITTFGGNAIYRISSGTSVRLGYEFEDVDRELEEMMDTETHTLKASIRYRPNRKLITRASYMYQDIEDQFMHPHGNKGPIDSTFEWSSSLPGTDKRWYEEYFYAQREAEATSLPEKVHELKATTTWAPSASYSVTVYARYRAEENDLNFNTYQQDSFSPGTNVWWAPINNLNMTMAYNFNKMKTENQMCVGWYHG